MMKNCIVLIAIITVTLLGCGRRPEESSSDNNSAPVSKVLYTNGFENGSAGEWKPRGGAKIEVATNVAHTGKNSLRISNRSLIWSAPEKDITDLTATPGSYRISCWVYIPKGSEVSSLQLTTEAITPDAKSWAQIDQPISVAQENWVKVSGVLNRKSGLDKLTVYVEPLNKTGDFYVDDVEIAMLAQ
jgi:hypothetical protein